MKPHRGAESDGGKLHAWTPATTQRRVPGKKPTATSSKSSLSTSSAAEATGKAFAQLPPSVQAALAFYQRRPIKVQHQDPIPHDHAPADRPSHHASSPSEPAQPAKPPVKQSGTPSNEATTTKSQPKEAPPPEKQQEQLLSVSALSMSTSAPQPKPPVPPLSLNKITSAPSQVMPLAQSAQVPPVVSSSAPVEDKESVKLSEEELSLLLGQVNELKNALDVYRAELETERRRRIEAEDQLRSLWATGQKGGSHRSAADSTGAAGDNVLVKLEILENQNRMLRQRLLAASTSRSM